MKRKTIMISQQDFATQSDDWLTGFEAGALAGQEVAAEEKI